MLNANPITCKYVNPLCPVNRAQIRFSPNSLREVNYTVVTSLLQATLRDPSSVGVLSVKYAEATGGRSLGGSGLICQGREKIAEFDTKRLIQQIAPITPLLLDTGARCDDPVRNQQPHHRRDAVVEVRRRIQRVRNHCYTWLALLTSASFPFSGLPKTTAALHGARCVCVGGVGGGSRPMKTVCSRVQVDEFVVENAPRMKNELNEGPTAIGLS